MKKRVVRCLLVSMFFMSSNVYCMFMHAVRNKVYKRAYCTHIKKSQSLKISLQLARTNIFNAPQYHHGLLEDLYDRNNNTIKKLEESICQLQQQNDIAVAHVYHDAPLDIKTLVALENKLQKKLPE